MRFDKEGSSSKTFLYTGKRPRRCVHAVIVSLARGERLDWKVAPFDEDCGSHGLGRADGVNIKTKPVAQIELVAMETVWVTIYSRLYYIPAIRVGRERSGK